mmetsp:Transcript_1007/g.3397  ORF Transcript_1007/g.3397 Transcript_1007/m.3397 type:complete len:202 (+) Transcript_1007:326-931(+)
MRVRCGRMVGCGGSGPPSSQRPGSSSSLVSRDGSRGATSATASGPRMGRSLGRTGRAVPDSRESPYSSAQGSSRPPARMCSTAQAMVSSTASVPPKARMRWLQVEPLQPAWPQEAGQPRQPRQEGRCCPGGGGLAGAGRGGGANRRSSAQLGTCSSWASLPTCGRRKNSTMGERKWSLHCSRLLLWSRFGVTRRFRVWQIS